MKALILATLAALAVCSSNAKADEIDEEILEWVLKPCALVGAAKQNIDLIPEEAARNISFDTITTMAMVLMELADTNARKREIAELARGKTFEQRRLMYKIALKSCVVGLWE